MRILSCYRCILFIIIPFFLASFTINAQQPAPDANRIAVLDFEVQSENPQYKFLGKGFAEFIAVDLSSVEGITIIDREKRNDVMEEQKFTLTGMTDESTNIEIGQLLAANYMISGSIFDMFGNLEVTVQLIDIELGSVAVNAQAGGEPKQYKKIVGKLSGALVAALDLSEEAKAAVEPEPAPAVEIDNEAADVVLASFSKAMDAVDKNDVREAKKNLQQVQKIDKTNEAAKYYLNKLQALSPKFRVEMVEYTTPYNAATLGFIDKMKIYGWFGMNFDPPGIQTEHGGAQSEGDYWVQDKQSASYFGVSIPLGSRFGLGAGFTMSRQDLKAYPNRNLVIDPPLLSLPANVDVYPAEGSDGIQSNLFNIGGYISFGARLTDWMSVGTSLMGWYTSAGPGYGNTVDEGFFFSIYPGLAFQVPGSSFAADINVAYTSFTMYYADFVNHEVVLGSLPLIIDGSLTYGLLNDRLFLGLKGISDIYYNARSGHALRLIPMVEVWPLTFLSIRGGYEYSHLSLNGEFKLAHGVVGGLTLKIWKFDINANLTYRQKPVRLLPGADVANMKLLIGIEFSPDWMERK